MRERVNDQKKKKKLKKRLIILGIIALVIIYIVISAKKAAQSLEEKPTIESIEKRSLSTTISATGKFESTTSQNMDSALVGKEIKKVNVKVGDKVSRGDILCSFDIDDIRDSYNLAASSLESTKEQADISVNAAKRARDEIQKVKDNYYSLQDSITTMTIQRGQIQQEIEQYRGYVDQAKTDEEKRVNQATVDDLNRRLDEINRTLPAKEAEFNAMKMTYNESQVNSQLDAANDQIRSAELSTKTAIDQTQSQVNTLREQLDKGTIKSLVSGTVTQVNVKEGETFAGGSVIKVEGINDFKVVAQISEYDIADIKEGMKVIIKSDSTRDTEIPGTVTFVAPTATTYEAVPGMTTGMSTAPTFKIEISVNEPNERLRIGMTAKLSIVKEEVIDVLSVPYDAVYKRDDGTFYVRVQNDDETEREVTVTKGLESDYYTEIKSDEIKEGMKVIVPSLSSMDALGEMINSVGATTGL